VALEDPIDAAFVRELNDGMVGCEVPEAIMEVLCRENLKLPARVWRGAFEGLLAAEPPLDTGPISAPTLIAWGARDSLLPRADQEAMAAQIPGAPHQHFARSRLPTRWWAPMRSRFARASTNRGEPPPLVIRAPRCPPFDSRA